MNISFEIHFGGKIHNTSGEFVFWAVCPKLSSVDHDVSNNHHALRQFIEQCISNKTNINQKMLDDLGCAPLVPLSDDDDYRTPNDQLVHQNINNIFNFLKIEAAKVLDVSSVEVNNEFMFGRLSFIITSMI